MKTTIQTAAILLVSTLGFARLSHADYNLANNGKEIVCHGEGDAYIVLNAKRTKFTSTEAGKRHTFKINSVEGDGDTSVVYVSQGAALALDDQGDKFFKGDDQYGLDLSCK